jgi:4'-phosphopantetheinyl transferase EntD
VLTAIHIPDAPEPVPGSVLERLHAEEVEFARNLRGYRQVQFVGGRLAIRSALQQLGLKSVPVLPDERGAPVLPKGASGSITHKGDLALAMVARDGLGTLGVDLEDYGPPRPSIAERVLVPEETDALAGLAEERRWIALLLRFSIKEAVYKALDPFVQRYVGFHEAVVRPDLHGWAEVELRLEKGEGPFEVEARYEWLFGRIVTSARIREVRLDTQRLAARS